MEGRGFVSLRQDTIGFLDEDLQKHPRGAWVVESAEHLTLRLGAGHDLRTMGSSAVLVSALAWSSLELLSPSAPLPPALTHTRSLSNK